MSLAPEASDLPGIMLYVAVMLAPSVIHQCVSPCPPKLSFLKANTTTTNSKGYYF